MKTPVNLLWTSGWDSTFRLLNLVVIQKKTVQPYYIISRSRQSCQMEIQTMENIKELIFKKNPLAKSLLLPTIYKERSSIKDNDLITRQYERLLKMHPLGDQYEYLARFAEEAGLSDLELSIHQDDKARKFIENYVIGESDNESYKLNDELIQSDSDLALFKYFRFPILNLTKLDMQQMAIKHNFLDIMNQTWFCHSPKNNKPCGICNPCSTTIQEGLRRRLPLSSQLRNFIQYTLKPPVKHLLKPDKKHIATDMT